MSVGDHSSQHVLVGRIAKAHGIHGEVTVEVRTDAPEQRFAVGASLTAKSRDGTSRELTIVTVRPFGGSDARLLVRFAQIATREVAAALRGTLLLTTIAALPPIDDPDEFYDHELAGLRAESLDGSLVGVVREVLHTPGGELLELERAGEIVLVPFVKAIVPVVDVAAGKVILDPPAGLLDAP